MNDGDCARRVFNGLQPENNRVALYNGYTVWEKKAAINGGADKIHIPKAKAGVREQPITKHLADFLAGYIDAMQPGCPWLFPSSSARSGHRTSMRKPFIRSVEKAGLDNKKVIRHTLRHTAITHLVQAVDLPTVQRISGHKTLEMVIRYAHQNGAHIDEAMDKLQNRLKLAS